MEEEEEEEEEVFIYLQTKKNKNNLFTGDVLPISRLFLPWTRSLSRAKGVKEK